MSVGIGGFCRKVFENDNEAIYEYSSYNLNETQYRNQEGKADGFITMTKSALDKNISSDFSVKELAENGKVTIENSDNTWKTEDGYDIVALRLCRKLIREYQLKGNFPETENYNT